MSATHARKKPFLRLATAAVAMVAALGMAACSGGAATSSSSSSAQVGDRTPEQIQEAGEIVIGIFSDKAPFGYIDADGKPAGYDVVYGDRIAADLGIAERGARVAQRGAPAELAAEPGPFRDFVEASTAASRWHLLRD